MDMRCIVRESLDTLDFFESTNDQTAPMLNRIIAANGFKQTVLYTNRLPQGTWTTVQVSKD